jgi:hypothetical protein
MAIHVLSVSRSHFRESGTRIILVSHAGILTTSSTQHSERSTLRNEEDAAPKQTEKMHIPARWWSSSMFVRIHSCDDVRSCSSGAPILASLKERNCAIALNTAILAAYDPLSPLLFGRVPPLVGPNNDDDDTDNVPTRMATSGIHSKIGLSPSTSHSFRSFSTIVAKHLFK